MIEKYCYGIENYRTKAAKIYDCNVRSGENGTNIPCLEIVDQDIHHNETVQINAAAANIDSSSTDTENSEIVKHDNEILLLVILKKNYAIYNFDENTDREGPNSSVLQIFGLKKTTKRLERKK